MEKFQSVKVIDGFSTCFRQWKAEDTHCKFLHGYSISFEVTFEGPLDYRNWVADFGFMKRATNKMTIPQPHDCIHEELQPDSWFKYFFDHTVILAADDPELPLFSELRVSGAIQLRILDQVGCEMFAKFVYDELNKFIFKETGDRVRVVQVKCSEHSKNSALYTSR